MKTHSKLFGCASLVLAFLTLAFPLQLKAHGSSGSDSTTAPDYGVSAASTSEVPISGSELVTLESVLTALVTPTVQTVNVAVATGSGMPIMVYPGEVFPPDIPTNKIVTPTAGLRITNTVYTATGKASEIQLPNTAVAVITNVYYSLNSAAWTNASTSSHWTNWTATLNLTLGTNVLQSYAIDSSGNVSPTSSVSCVAVFLTKLTVTTNGNGTLSPNYNGSSLAVGGSYTLTATPAAGFAFANWSEAPGIVLTNSRTLSFTMVSNLVLTANFTDTQKPALTITSPVANQQVSSNSFNIRGTASDNVAVARVAYRFNGGGWLVATGTNNWTVPAELTPGTNIFQAYAVDTSGNVSPTNTVSFLYVDKTALIATINGKGALSPNYNLQLLQIGQNYTMTATPAAGFVFNNWTSQQIVYEPQAPPVFGLSVKPKDTGFGSSGTSVPEGNQGNIVLIETNAVVLTNKPTLTFNMSANLALVANLTDIAPPTVTITSPTVNQQVTNSYIVLRGTASDNAAVSNVWYQVDGEGWYLATGTNTWSAVAYLNTGTNTIQAYAVDTSGNVSPTNLVHCVYVQKSTMTLTINGQGAVSPNYNGQYLTVGQNYTMKATPATGFGFVNWVEAVPFVNDTHPAISSRLATQPELSYILSTNPTLTFTMSPGLDLAASFADVAPPTLTISAPRPSQNLSNSVCYVLGLAKDNVAVAGVYCRINQGEWGEATSGNNWTNWTVTLPMVSGTNTVQAYAVDTSGNFSATNTVSFVNLQTGVAPGSLNGLLATITSDNGGVISVGFGAGTFSLHPEDTNSTPDVGTYSYAVDNSTQAQLTVTGMASPGNSSTPEVVDLTFTSPDAGTYYNESSGDYGAISFASAPSLARGTLSGSKILIFEGGGRATLAFGNGTVTFTDSSGEANSFSYALQSYSPVGCLITAGDPVNGTNYIILSYLATNNGDIYVNSYDNQGNTQGPDFGAFVFPSASPVAPSSPVGLAARQVNSDGSVTTTAFGISGFSQQSTDAGQDFDVGTYGFEKISSSNTVVNLTVVAPPTQTNNSGSAYLTYVAPNFFEITNRDDGGNLKIRGLSLMPVTTEVAMVSPGLTIHATNSNGTVDAVTFHSNGGFTQVESNSGNAGTSVGTYTYGLYGPIGAMLVLTYTSSSTPYSMVGDVNYVQVTYTGINVGTYFSTFYDNSGDPPFGNTGSFLLH